jgi:hypothetical protein
LGDGWKRECTVERDASWGIMKLRVDGGHAINFGEVLVRRWPWNGGGQGPKEMESIPVVTSIF